jgi:putative sterol carrier protein
MGFPYRDTEQAKAFVLEFIERLREVDVIREGWQKLDMLIAIHIKQPDIDFWIDTRGGKLELATEKPDGEEEAALTLTADLFHKLYTGQENAMMAFTQRKIQPKGRVSGIMQLTNTMPQAVAVYRQYLQEKGLAG